MGPFPIDDTFGMGTAIIMLSNSLNQGKTMRRFNSVLFTNFEVPSLMLTKHQSKASNLR
jgi:hypothetical protein